MAAAIYKYSSAVMVGKNPSPSRAVIYNPQGSTFHTTFFDANEFKSRELVNLSEQNDDRARQSNGIASYILSKQTFNYTDKPQMEQPYMQKIFDSYKLDDELESIFYARQPEEVANGGRVIQNDVV